MVTFKKLQILTGVFVMLSALTICVYQLEFHNIEQVVREIKWQYILASFFLTNLTLILSTFRFGSLIRNFGVEDSWRSMHRTNLYSMLYSQLVLPLVLQITGRISYGSQSALKLYAPVTLIEKGFSFAVIIIAGGFSASYFLGYDFLESGFLISLLWMAVIILLTALMSIYTILDKTDRIELADLAADISKLGLSSTLAITIFMQASILLSLYFLSLNFTNDISTTKLLGALTLVMLASTIPISFSGWGIREASAGALFVVLGLPFEAGVVLGLLYGLIYLIAIIATIPLMREGSGPSIIQKKSLHLFNPLNTLKFACFISVTLMVFQIKIPLKTSLLTVNMADAIIFLLAINVLITATLEKRLLTIWQHRSTWLGLLCFIVMIFLTWFVGYIKFGSNDWATGNRLIGLILIFSYLFAGTSLKSEISQAWLKKCLLSASWVLIFSIPLALICHKIMPDNVLVYFNLNSTVSSFLGDRNSLAFFCCMMFILIYYFVSKDSINPNQERNFHNIIGCLFAILIFASSRSGWGGAVIMAISCLQLFNMDSLKRILYAAFGSSIAFFMTIKLLEAILFQEVGKIAVFERAPEQVFVITDLRWNLYLEAYQLFLTDKLFGAGLGAMIQGTGFVIHNAPLWILAEGGIVGLGLVLPLAFVLLKYCFVSKNQRERNSILIFCLIVGGFCLFQDIVYQRVLWLVLGFLISSEFGKNNKHTNSVYENSP